MWKKSKLNNLLNSKSIAFYNKINKDQIIQNYKYNIYEYINIINKIYECNI